MWKWSLSGSLFQLGSVVEHFCCTMLLFTRWVRVVTSKSATTGWFKVAYYSVYAYLAIASTLIFPHETVCFVTSQLHSVCFSWRWQLCNKVQCQPMEIASDLRCRNFDVCLIFTRLIRGHYLLELSWIYFGDFKKSRLCILLSTNTIFSWQSHYKLLPRPTLHYLLYCFFWQSKINVRLRDF